MKIELKNVSKKIKGKTVLEDINMFFETGTVYGLVGENGSGKTMLLRLMAGLIHPDSGSIIIDGKYCKVMRPGIVKTGLTLENTTLYTHMTGFENLKYLGDLSSGIADNQIWDVMRSVGLDPMDGRRVGKYSLGMKQKLVLAQAFMEKPNLLLLDEPTNALDNETVEKIRKMIEEQKEERITVLASHNKEDIEMLCDMVYFVANGRVEIKQ